MKVQHIVSDLDGKEIKDFMHISIERPGYTIEYPPNCYTNRLEVDLQENQIQPFLSKLAYHRMEIMPRMILEEKS